MKLLYVGNITGPFGIKGEIKILSETNHKNEIFKVGNGLYIDNKKYIIENVKQNPKCEIIKFNGIEDISQTDEILKKEVYVNKDDINVDFLLIELMNMDVYENEKKIGKVKEILLNKKYNYIKVCDIIIPLSDNFIEKFDFENNIIYVKNIGELNEN